MSPHGIQEDLSDKTFYTKVYFRVNFPTKFGETVIVVGSHPSLGDWERSRGHILSTSEDIHPIWHSRVPVSLPLNTQVQYKYVAVGPSNLNYRWEEHESNREIKPTGGFMTVEDDHGLYRLKTQSEESVGADNAMPLDSMTQGNPENEARRLFDDIFKGKVDIDKNDAVIFCSMELPIRVTRNSDGGFVVKNRKSSMLPSLYSLRFDSPRTIKFLGWPGIHLDTDEEKQQLTTLLVENYHCVPIFPPEDIFNVYLEFCHGFLWPLFHNVLSLNLQILKRLTEELWPAYKIINKFFADRISIHLHENDLIWIHDYQLLLLPMFLVRKMKRANVGLFLHIPFPSNELFRCIPMRDELLNGMLFADLIGFHIYEYASNFFVSCAYLSGYEQKSKTGGGLSLECDGHEVIIHVNHVHIQYNDVRERVEKSLEVQNCTEALREGFRGRFIFGSVDRCEHLAGLILKIKAFQSFLRDYPSAQGRVVLIQHAYPVMSVWNNADIQTELQAFVDSVNREFEFVCGTNQSVKHIYLHIREVSREEKYALFQAADCLLDTSLRDGFNINPLEFICCRRDKPAALILSEFIGCIRSLTCAFRCNPWEIEGTASMMDKALHMSFEELRGRFEWDQKFLERHNTRQWAEQFLKDLKRARKPENMDYVMCGIGGTSRLVGMPVFFRPLEESEIVNAVRQSRRRYFFFDYEGTLAYDRRRSNTLPAASKDLLARGTSPLDGVKECLRSLLEDSRNTVVILSGRDKQHLEQWFGDVDGLGLCAEHGFYYRVPAITGNEWHCVSKKVDLTWRDITLEVLTHFVNQTQGSFIENKGSAVVFQHRDADPEFGSIQAKEVASALKLILAPYQVNVVSGKGYVEVRLSGINKGSAVLMILNKLTKQYGEADFILCIGDDRSDEDMFTVLNDQGHLYYREEGGGSDMQTFSKEISAALVNEGEVNDLFSENSRFSWGGIPSFSMQSSSSPSHSTKRLFTCTVGKKPSAARYYLNDTSDVFQLLKAIEGTIRPDSASARASLNSLPRSIGHPVNQYDSLSNEPLRAWSNVHDPSIQQLFQSYSMHSHNGILGNFRSGEMDSSSEILESSLEDSVYQS